jgi:hypothetical protein
MGPGNQAGTRRLTTRTGCAATAGGAGSMGLLTPGPGRTACLTLGWCADGRSAEASRGPRSAMRDRATARPGPTAGRLNRAIAASPAGGRDSGKEMGLELLARPERPAQGRPSGLSENRRGGRNQAITPPRIGRISNRSLAALQVIQSWK